MPLLVSLADLRDIVVVVWGIISAVFFLIGIIVMLMVGLSVRGLTRRINNLMEESVRPALGSVKDAADTVKGTTEFVGRTTVAPVVKTYGAFAGIKRGLEVLGKVRGR